MDLILDLAGVVGPALAGFLTVPVLQGVKAINKTIDKAPAIAKQMLGVGIAFGLTKAGSLLGVVLPPALSLFDGTSTEALIAASIAFGVHAGKKSRAGGQ